MEWANKPAEYAALRDAVYADTQRQLAAQGVKSITVYRGVSSHPGLHNGPQQTVKLHAASSFTTNPQKAKNFGGSHVLVAKVESERVFSLGGTGFGWYGSGSEREVVVMGSNSGVIVDVFSPGSLPSASALSPTGQPVLAKMW